MTNTIFNYLYRYYGSATPPKLSFIFQIDENCKYVNTKFSDEINFKDLIEQIDSAFQFNDLELRSDINSVLNNYSV